MACYPAVAPPAGTGFAWHAQASPDDDCDTLTSGYFLLELVNSPGMPALRYPHWEPGSLRYGWRSRI